MIRPDLSALRPDLSALRPDLSALRPTNPLTSLARAALGLVASRARPTPPRVRPACRPAPAPRLEVHPTLWR